MKRRLLALTLSLAFTGIAFAAPPVRVAAVPEGGRVADAEVDASGAIHLVWVKGGDVWYAKSTSAGRAFTTPLRVNSEPNTAHPPGMFRGPDIALGAKGRVHVIWYTNGFQRQRPKDEWGVYYSHLDPAGTAFASARNLNHLPGDGYSLAADGRGNVAVLAMAGKLGVLISGDDGETFAPSREIADADPCECCATRSVFAADGTFFAAYRDKEANIRDMFLIGGSDFKRTRLSTVAWPINGCPMTGNSLAKAGAGLIAAWETNGAITFARLDSHGAPGASVEVAPRGKYPIALATADGAVCVSWKEASVLKWRLFDRANKPLGEPGSAPAPAGDRFAGAVTREGEFVLFP